MSHYDPIRMGWLMPCPKGKQLVKLEDFRSIKPLPGSSAPSIFQISFYCKECQGLHIGLLTQDCLDLFCFEPLPIFHDLMTSRSDFEADLVREKWIVKITNGKWPLSFRCGHSQGVRPTWPSRIELIEPDLERSPSRYLVTHLCLGCEQAELVGAAPASLNINPLT